MTFTMFGTAHLGQARCICSSNPEGCPLHQRVLPIDAPDRSVCALTGEIADGLSFPALLPNAAEIAKLTAERDEALKQRDDAKAELDNMVDLTIEVGRLGNYLRHAIADRDEYRDRADEWRDKYEGAQCRMDEMAAEIRELKQAASK
jgi:hypothetical protein